MILSEVLKIYIFSYYSYFIVKFFNVCFFFFLACIQIIDVCGEGVELKSVLFNIEVTLLQFYSDKFYNNKFFMFSNKYFVYLNYISYLIKFLVNKGINHQNFLLV